MDKLRYLMAVLSLAFVSTFAMEALAEEPVSEDLRINLKLTDAEKAEFLSEMRQMLASIQGIMSGLGTDDRELIMESARLSGNRMARSTPESIRNKLPSAFKELGGPTHMMFEELVIRAETDDMDMLAEFTGQLMKQCLSCHAMFKVQ